MMVFTAILQYISKEGTLLEITLLLDTQLVSQH